jgi:hypothetical protein
MFHARMCDTQDYASQYAREIGELLQRMPRPLLLLLKTNDCLRWAVPGVLRAAGVGCAGTGGWAEDGNPACVCQPFSGKRTNCRFALA